MADSSQLLWPLNLRSALTSTFGEHRGGRFHNGIDLTTWGKTGVAVLATGDGEVVRVKASGVGYGRALYIRLDVGRMVVYAHLEDWLPEVSRYVRHEQESRGLYEVDLFPPPGTFRVKRGEVIGYTGHSGAGGPHLHFEVRSSGGDRTINPLIVGYQVSDHRAPVFHDVTIRPAEPGARVNGLHRPLTVSVKEIYPRRYEIPAVTTSGAVVMSAHVFDEADGKDLPLAIYRATLLVDGIERYSAVFDSIAFREQREVDFVYDPERADRGEPRVRHFFKRPGSTIRLHGDRDGSLDDLAPGSHQLLLTAADVSGNTSSVRLQLIVSDPPVIGTWLLESDGETTTALVHARDPEDAPLSLVARPVDDFGREGVQLTRVSPGWFACKSDGDSPLVIRAIDGSGVSSEPCIVGVGDRAIVRPPVLTSEARSHSGILTVRVAADRPLMGAPTAMVHGSTAGGRPVVSLDAPDTFSVHLRPDGIKGHVAIDVHAIPLSGEPFQARLDLDAQAASPGDESEMIWGGTTLRIGPRTLFAPAFVWAKEAGLPAPLGDGLRRVSSVVRLHPAELVLNEPAELWLELLSGMFPDRAALFVYNEKKSRWDMVDNLIDSTRVGGQIRRPGMFCLLRDIAAPVVIGTRPADGDTLSDRRPEIAVTMEDTGSGLHWSGLELTLDGATMIAEWDPEAAELRARPVVPLARGTHIVRVSATDRVGNAVERSINFSLAER